MSKFYVYVDETGDRGAPGDPGASSKVSPIFGMAALIVPETTTRALREAVRVLRSDFRVPDGKALSWKEHVKTHDRRRRAVEVLGGVAGVRVCYVYAKKSELRPDSYIKDPKRFYNYVALKSYKSVVWACRNMGATEVMIRFGHVRHHDHRDTKLYIDDEASKDQKIPYDLVKSMKWVSADRYEESQAADLFGGFLRAATWPSGPYGYTEPSYLLGVWHLIRKSETCAIPLGIMSMPNNDVLGNEPWFPCSDCEKTTKSLGTSTGRST